MDNNTKEEMKMDQAAISKKFSGDEEALELIRLSLKYHDWERMGKRECLMSIIGLLQDWGMCEDCNHEDYEPEYTGKAFVLMAKDGCIQVTPADSLKQGYVIEVSE